MSNDLWRWADPDGQQRRVRLDELRAALAGGLIAPNTPVWRSGWKAWQSAHDVPELTSSALSAANGVVPNIPPPPLAMVAMQHEFEAKAGGSFTPPPLAAEKNDEPPPPPRFVPLPVRPNSIPPPAPSSGQLPSVPPRAPSAGGPHIHSSLPTTIGLPPPPELVALAAAQTSAAARPVPPPGVASNGSASKDPMIEELSGSMLLDDSAPALQRGTNGPGAHPPPTDPVLHGFDEGGPSLSDDDDDGLGLPPRRRPQLTAIFDDLNAMKAGRPPKNKLLIGVVGVLVVSVGISLLALIVSAFRGDASERPAAGAGSSSAGTASSAKTQGAATTPSGTEAPADRDRASAAAAAAAVAATPVEEPKPRTEGGFGDCSIAGEAHVVSPRAFGQAGVEAVSVPGAIALGFALDPRSGVAVTVDPASIGITATLKARAAGDARRMTPILERGKLILVPGLDKKNDKLLGRRVVGTRPAIDIGVADASLVWAPRDQNSWAKLFPLDAEGAREGVVDAIRAVPLGTGKGVAVTFRRGNAVYVGAAKGDAVLAPAGSLSRIPGLGQVGSPSITTSGDDIIVAWSDRVSAQEPWQVRWTKLPIGGTPAEPRQLALPEGGLGTQAMSPSVAGIGGGRFVIAWSEGTPTHQVRAITLDGDGTPSGSAMALSAAGVNAGQPQVAIGTDGRGVVAFLAAKAKLYEVHATPVACAAK